MNRSRRQRFGPNDDDLGARRSPFTGTGAAKPSRLAWRDFCSSYKTHIELLVSTQIANHMFLESPPGACIPARNHITLFEVCSEMRGEGVMTPRFDARRTRRRPPRGPSETRGTFCLKRTREGRPRLASRVRGTIT